MTLPKFFSVASKDFDNFDTMLFEESTIININPSLPEQQQQQLQHQSELNSQQQQQHQQQQLLNSINPLRSPTTSAHSSIRNVNHSEATNTMYDVSDLSDATNSCLTPQQLHSENQEAQPYVECIMPAIYLTKDFISWKKHHLLANGYTHIIIIDKHIQELYYPNQQPDIFKFCSMENDNTKNLRHDVRHDNSSSLNAFDYYCPAESSTKYLSFGKKFQVIDLNFGEKYSTAVLPNCYKAVLFIHEALQAGGTILVIDCNGGEQKCITIIVAYLMFKNNICFSDAFDRFKKFYKKADLDRYYKSQLYEYEPILQVQRAQSRGHSCSRNLHAATLKRKKAHDDYVPTLDNNNASSIASFAATRFEYTNTTAGINASATELLDNCNPLNRFDSTQLERKELKVAHSDNQNQNTFNRFMGETASSTAITTGGWYNWDECAME